MDKQTEPTISELIKESHATAREHGFWDDPHPNAAEKIALMHSELSEALEELRSWHPLQEIYYATLSRPDLLTVPPKPEGVPIELADLLIRVFDFCGYYNIPLTDALHLKMLYNKSRPRKHGKEF